MGDERLAAIGAHSVARGVDDTLEAKEGSIPRHDRKRNDMVLVIENGMLGTNKKNQIQMLTYVTATIFPKQNVLPPLFIHRQPVLTTKPSHSMVTFASLQNI
jgi:hypothetical protein